MTKARTDLIAAMRKLVAAEITEAVLRRMGISEHKQKEIDELRRAATEGMETALVNYEQQLGKQISK